MLANKEYRLLNKGGYVINTYLFYLNAVTVWIKTDESYYA